MIIEGYHTVEDRGNPEEIKQSGPFKCTRSNAWLGEGYYFWDTNESLAHDWGKKAYRDRGYVICKASINLDETIMDLFGSVLHQMEFKAAYFKLKQILPEGKEPFVGQIIRFLKRNEAFLYNGIRAADEPESTIFVSFGGRREEQMVINQRVQICLINKNNLISPTFQIFYPEKYIDQTHENANVN